MKLIQRIKRLKKIKLPFKPKGKKNSIWKKVERSIGVDVNGLAQKIHEENCRDAQEN